MAEENEVLTTDPEQAADVTPEADVTEETAEVAVADQVEAIEILEEAEVTAGESE